MVGGFRNENERGLAAGEHPIAGFDGILAVTRQTASSSSTTNNTGWS
jgi:hypothetical protein